MISSGLFIRMSKKHLDKLLISLGLHSSQVCLVKMGDPAPIHRCFDGYVPMCFAG